jgi:hypothetical protein
MACAEHRVRQAKDQPEAGLMQQLGEQGHQRHPGRSLDLRQQRRKQPSASNGGENSE